MSCRRRDCNPLQRTAEAPNSLDDGAVVQLAQAGLYAYALAAVRYARARLTGMGVDVRRWDALYDATPPERRTLRADEGGIAAFSPIITEAVDGDPVARRIADARTRAALLFTMRATIERAERRWAAAPPPPPARR